MDAGVVNASVIEKALAESRASIEGKGVDGAALLDEVETFIGRFVRYPSEHARVAHTLWIAHTWLMDKWDSTPRIMFASPEPGSGKTRALEVSEPLVPRPVHAVNTTPAYLFRKVSDEVGPPTILYDEIDTVFGPKAKEPSIENLTPSRNYSISRANRSIWSFPRLGTLSDWKTPHRDDGSCHRNNGKPYTSNSKRMLSCSGS